MAENYTPTGATAAAIERFTSAEAATGTYGTMMRTFHTEMADRTRFLATTGLIAFPATQVTSADANTLDDYEEGTWTPALNCGTSGSITLSTATGFYTKVGRLVTLTARCTVLSVSSPLGQLSVGNNPFTSAVFTGVAVFAAGLEATATSPLIGSVQATATIFIDKMVSGVQTNMAADVKAASTILINVSFSV